MNKNKIYAGVLIGLFAMLSLSAFVVIQPMKSNPKFIIASWDFPDEYGQGIYEVSVWENSTGVFLHVGNSAFAGDSSFNIPIGAFVLIKTESYLNSSLVGISSVAEGKNHLKHNITVSCSGDIIFQQSNFTYNYGDDYMGEIYNYGYNVYTNFSTQANAIYVVELTYEVFYLGDSVEYEDSNQSITGFAETLPDDVLFYPDELNYDMTTCLESGNVTGGTETNTYASMVADDASNWRGSSSGSALYLYFTVGNLGDAESVDIHYEALSSSASTDYIGLYLDNPYGADLLIVNDTDAVSDAVIDGYTTITDFQDYVFNSVFTFYFYTTYKAPVTVIDADYFDIRTMTLASDGYAEDFSDVSGWTAYENEDSESLSTDGDVATFTADFTSDGAGAYDSWFTNDVSISDISGMYIELRNKVNNTNLIALQIFLYELDDHAGDYLKFQFSRYTSYWTYKTALSAYSTQSGTVTAIESIAFRLFGAVGDNVEFKTDYLRISNSTSMGWQHDGSTTAGISSADGGTISTDGDNLTLTSDTDASSFEFAFDTTTTQASLSTAYYPFLVVNCTSVSEGDGWKLEQYDGSAWATLQSSYITTGGIYRYNMKPLDTYVQKWRLNFTQTATIMFNFIKAYSIANFTYTGTGTSTDDVLYVFAGTLYCSATSITSMVLDHDPVLSVDTASFLTTYNVTTGAGIPQTDYYITGSGAPYWIGYSSETQGELPSSILTDLRIKFTASANIAAITFTFAYPIPTWNLVTTATLIFSVPIDETALNWFLVFLGLFMIPASTLYLVKGGKDNMSMNKVFFFIIAFVLGWALVIGGIFG